MVQILKCPPGFKAAAEQKSVDISKQQKFENN
jgi:hypothetical protein